MATLCSHPPQGVGSYWVGELADPALLLVRPVDVHVLSVRLVPEKLLSCLKLLSPFQITFLFLLPAAPQHSCFKLMSLLAWHRRASRSKEATSKNYICGRTGLGQGKMG